MKLNTDICYLLMSDYKYEHIWVQIGKDQTWEEKEVKLFGVTIDTDLKFDRHINKICSKAKCSL